MRIGRKIREVTIVPARPPLPEPIRLPERPEPAKPRETPPSPKRDPVPVSRR